MQVVTPELGCNFNAIHYPANDWREFFCAGFEKQPNRDYEYQSYRSVMKYCRMHQGKKYLESGNFAALEANLP